MLSFSDYFTEGFRHISDPAGYDHILFILTLAIVYSFRDWKPVLGLVTAFTVGHSLTLALATMRILLLPTDWIEFLIPVTILIGSCLNVAAAEKHRSLTTVYLLTVFFGLIHGAGFSNFLRSLLGREESLTLPLLAFNLGLEAGQLAIVALTLLLTYLFTEKTGLFTRRSWTIFISGGTFGIALIMALERWPVGS